MKTEQVGHVPVLRVCVLPVLVPFDEVSGSPDLQRMQVVTVMLPLIPQFGISPQRFACLDDIREQLPAYFQVHRRAYGHLAGIPVFINESVLRGGRR